MTHTCHLPWYIIFQFKVDALGEGAFSSSFSFSGTAKSSAFSSVVMLMVSLESMGCFPSDSPAHGTNGSFVSAHDDAPEQNYRHVSM